MNTLSKAAHVLFTKKKYKVLAISDEKIDVIKQDYIASAYKNAIYPSLETLISKGPGYIILVDFLGNIVIKDLYRYRSEITLEGTDFYGTHIRRYTVFPFLGRLYLIPSK